MNPALSKLKECMNNRKGGVKIPFLLSLTVKIFVILLLFVIFFVGYNSLILDKSLAALDASLQTLKTGDALGIGLLLDVDSVNEIIKEDFNQSRLSKLDYLSSTIIERAESQDVQILLSGLIEERSSKRANFLKTLDNSVLTFRRNLNKTAIFSQRNREKIKNDLEDAIDQHYKGDFEEAKALYQDIIKMAGTSHYADIARALLENLEKQVALKNRRNKLLIDLEQLTDTNDISLASYELGLIEIQLLDFHKAKDYFTKVQEISVDPNLIARANFYLGWTSKQEGNLEQGIEYFNQLLQAPADENLVIGSKFQIADSFKRKGEFEKAAELFRDLAKKHSESAAASLFLTFSKFTYIFDLDKSHKANEITAELIEYYPASELLETTRKELKVEQSPLDYLTTVSYTHLTLPTKRIV